MLSQATGYAATALGFLAAANGKSLLVKDIAEGTGVPSPYLAKIVNLLARRGILLTQRGIGGGVGLANRPGAISLYDLAVALDDASIQPRCMLGTAECTDSRACPAHTFWSCKRAEYIAFLKATTIADIAKFEEARRAGVSGPAMPTILGVAAPERTTENSPPQP